VTPPAADAGAPAPASDDRPRDFGIVRALPRAHLIAVGVASVLLSAACLAQFGLEPRTLIGAIFVSTLALLTATDLDRRLIPNVVVVPATALVLALQVTFYPDQWLEWVVATFGAALFFFLPLLIVPTGMGMGDVKLAALLGAALGKSVILGVFVGLAAGAIFSIAVLIREGLRARKKTIPYGPFLAFGGLVALFLGGPWPN
jgi:leader peptidase (prepilin peptidase) / N-methyltransferase